MESSRRSRKKYNTNNSTAKLCVRSLYLPHTKNGPELLDKADNPVYKGASGAADCSKLCSMIRRLQFTIPSPMENRYESRNATFNSDSIHFQSISGRAFKDRWYGELSFQWLKIQPGRRGTRRLTKKLGDRLLFVRDGYGEKSNKRYRHPSFLISQKFFMSLQKL